MSRTPRLSRRMLTLALGAFALALPSLPRAQSGPPPPVHFGAWGVDLTAMDRSVNPGDDFDKFVNGAWFARTEIPADQGSAGVGYDVFNRSQDQIRAIIEHAPPTSQLGGMYQSFMKEDAVEAAGDTPLKAELARVTALADRTAFARFMGVTNGTFGFGVVGPEVGPDPAKPAMNTLFLGQAGIGLPDRDYYLNDTFKPQRDAYRAYIERTFTLVGYADPAKSADAVIAFETAIAKASWPVADRRDIDKVNNPMTLAELKAYAPGVDWDVFFAGSEITLHGEKIIVTEKTAVRDIAALYAQTPLDTLKAWEVFHVTDPATKAPAMRNPFAYIKPGDMPVPDAAVEKLVARDVKFGVCNLALTHLSGMVAGKMGLKGEEVKKDWVAGLLPGMTVVPSGVVAVNGAQAHGCSYCFAG